MEKVRGLQAVRLTEIPRAERLSAARRVAREGTHEPEELLLAALFPSDRVYFIRTQAVWEALAAA